MIYNIMTCENFSTGVFGECSLAWLAFGLLLFIVLISNRQMDNLGLEYNLAFGFLGMVIPYLIIITFSGSIKYGLLSGLAGLVVGGVIGAMFFGGSGGEGGGDEGWF